MSVGISRVYRFDECPICFRRPNEINAGGEFQVIGHLTGRAGCIHAVCLPCIQRGDQVRVEMRRENRAAGRQEMHLMSCSMRQKCVTCRSLLSNSEPEAGGRGVQGRLFTLRVVRLTGEGPVREGENDDGVQVLNENGDPAFIGEIINSEDMPLDPEGGSRIEITCETIGRELVGRVVSLVLGAIAGAAFGMAYLGGIMALKDVAVPEEGIFVPREELDGLSPGFLVILVGGGVFGIYFGVIGACANPCGDDMGSVGALAGKAIVSGLEELNGQIERINRAWSGLFVAAAQQPVG